MKKFINLSVILLYALISRADHITGGEMFYTLSGTANGEFQYSVTLKFFMRCNSGRLFYNPAIVSVFNKRTNVFVTDVSVSLANQVTLSLTNSNPCITNPPTVCYEVGYYHFNVSLPASADGYKLASTVTYRIQGINNLNPGYNQAGATYTAEIPGTSEVSNGATNSSANFTGNDLVIVCADNSFSYSFAAVDADGDRLRYSFCEAFTHSGGAAGTLSPTPGPPPYQSVPYGIPYSGQQPLGDMVTIDPDSGIITGTAPSAGVYVVTVCVEEIRNGIVIAVQRKDLQINIAPCTIAAAQLQPEYLLCKDTKTLFLANLSTSPLIKTYSWTVFDRAGTRLTNSSNASPNYTFADTGIYKIKLVVNSGQACSDSTTSIAKVYPGFVPAFTSTGVCLNKPTVFTDGTSSVFGTVNFWKWDFGEAASATDISDVQHPAYTYQSTGRKYTQLAVGNSVGCRDTLIDYITIVEKPPLNLGFRDTLICLNDVVQLKSAANGIYSWTPSVNIIDANTKTPTVSPKTNTTYYVDLDDNGCLNRDSVQVRVTDHVDLQTMNDTTICQGDTIELRVSSNGFNYSWSPAIQVIDPATPNPLAVTTGTTSYFVTARIGGCSATRSVTVKTIPYPVADAGPDTMICFRTSAQLNATITGNSFTWSPASTLVNSNELNPVASPQSTTSYTLIVYESNGCPKPGLDQVKVTVLPPIKLSVSPDTSIIAGQPIQLQANGGTNYLWTPSIGLTDANIANPVATISHIGDSIRYRVQAFNEAGCYESGTVLIKIFKTLPSVFVPNAFTPDGDSKNDLLRPLAVGMKHIEYFNVYNRWGQLIFSTTMNNQGWDGTIKGRPQNSGIYVWSVKAIDYSGKPYFQKGTATLIR
jgi:gliding motility-associated-like protein